MTSDNGHNPLPPPRRLTTSEPPSNLSSKERSPINIPPLRETAAAAENQRIISRNRLGGLIVGVVIAAGLMGVSFWWGHELGRKSNNNLPIPVVKADNSPVKVVPENPGGLQVPHRDKLVLDSRETSKELTTGSTVIQPSPEKPVLLTKSVEQEVLSDSPPIIEPEKPVLEEVTDAERSVIPSALPRIAESQLENVESQNIVKKHDPEDEKSTPEDTKSSSNFAQSTSRDNFVIAGNNSISQSTTQQQIEEKSTTIKQEKGLTPISRSKAYRVQLASYRSEENALNGWNKIRARFKKMLAKFEPTISRVNLSDKGVFHRLQVGPFPTKAEAAALCKKLNALNQGCLVVKPIL